MQLQFDPFTELSKTQKRFLEKIQLQGKEKNKTKPNFYCILKIWEL